MSHASEPLRPVQVIAQRVKALRRQHGWTAAQLAERMAEAGLRWDRFTVQNLENGRRANVSVEEFLALAYVLDVAPVHLVVPTDSEETTPYQVTPAGTSVAAELARAWIRGQTPIGDQDQRRFYAEVPDGEWRPPASTEVLHWDLRDIDMLRRAAESGNADPAKVAGAIDQLRREVARRIQEGEQGA